MGWGWGAGGCKLKAYVHVQVKWGSKITKFERSYFKSVDKYFDWDSLILLCLMKN